MSELNKEIDMSTTVTLPSLPSDWHTTLIGILTAIGTLLQQYSSTGTLTWERVGIAVVIAVVCWFIPAKTPPVDQAKIVDTVVGIVNSTLPSAVPAGLTSELSPVEKQILGAVQGALQGLGQNTTTPVTPTPPTA